MKYEDFLAVTDLYDQKKLLQQKYNKLLEKEIECANNRCDVLYQEQQIEKQIKEIIEKSHKREN